MTNRALVLVWLGLFCAVAGPARAAEEAESRFFWQPSLRIGADVNDNARLARGGEDDDASMRLRPRFEMGYQSTALEAGADLGVDLRRHTQDESLNDTFYRARGHVEMGLLPGFTLRLQDDYVPRAVALGVPDDFVGNLVQTNRAAAELRFTKALGEKSELSIGASGARLDGDTISTLVPGPGGAPAPGRFRPDHWEGGGFLRIARNLGSRGQLFAKGLASHRAFESADAASHSEFSGVLGAEFRPIDGLRLHLEGGGGAIEFDDGASEPRFTGRADLAYRLSRWRFGAGVHHGLTTDLVGNAFTNLAGRLVVERSFGSHTRATLTGFGSLLDAASQATEKDGFGGAELLIRRQLSRHFALDVSYRFWENAGGRSANDFRQHRGYFELSYVY